MLQGDCRQLLGRLRSDSVHCTITSPPYASLKNYGSKQQIGFGQDSLKEYLDDMSSVFHELLRVTSTGGALWLVVGSYKENGELIALPWEMLSRAKDEGWKPQECVIWEKERSLPWSHHGRFRPVSEFIFLLSKGDLSLFDLEAVRNAEYLSPYWVRYPERYNPSGKAPTDVWHYPIPKQGSWSNGGVRHFCPFPIELVHRMLSITTKPGDVVFDPFAGTGTVLAVAHYMKRIGFGTEVNHKFKKHFDQSGYNELIERSKLTLGVERQAESALSRVIIELRMLKYPRTLYVEVDRADRLNGTADAAIAAFVLRSAKISKRNQDNRNCLGTLEIDILARRNAPISKLRKAVTRVMQKAPLSKFGLDVDARIVADSTWSAPGYFDLYQRGGWQIYRQGRFHKFAVNVSRNDLATAIKSDAEQESKIPPIASKLSVSIDNYTTG